MEPDAEGAMKIKQTISHSNYKLNLYFYILLVGKHKRTKEMFSHKTYLKLYNVRYALADFLCLVNRLYCHILMSKIFIFQHTSKYAIR